MAVYIINDKTGEIMSMHLIHKGQTYPIPEGYHITHREYNSKEEKVWVDKDA